MDNQDTPQFYDPNDPLVTKALQSMLEQDGLTFEQKLKLLSALSAKHVSEDPQVTVARINAGTKEKSWLKEGVLVAVVTAIASIATGYVAGFFEFKSQIEEAITTLETVKEQQKGETSRAHSANTANLRSIELNQRADILQHVLVINPLELGNIGQDELETRAIQERRARICLLATFGIIEIPEEVIGIKKANLKEYAEKGNALLEKRYKCNSEAELPASLPLSSPTSHLEKQPTLQSSELKFSSISPRTEFNFSVSDGYLMDNGQRVTFLESPHGGAFNDLSDRRYIVVDFTASPSAQSYVNWMLNSSSRVSTHLVIGRFGEVIQLRRFDQKAWHAGNSALDGLTSLNNYSFGVELVNWGQLNGGLSWANKKLPPDQITKLEDGTQWQTYTDTQITTLKAVLSAMVKAYPSVKKIVSQKQISPKTKVGPGPLIDVTGLSKELIAE